MSGAYVFIEEAERDWSFSRKDLSIYGEEGTRSREALIYVKDAKLAEKIAAGMQYEHGISGHESFAALL